jgi:hypothetical protein
MDAVDKVYVVSLVYEYEGSEIVAVYRDEEDAKAYVSKRGTGFAGSYYEYSEWEVTESSGNRLLQSADQPEHD